MENMNSSTPTSTPEECYQKLEKLKEIRAKTVQAVKMKLVIKENLQEAAEEKVAMEKYKKELELLMREKMAHVDELRQIHTDINTIESLIKQSTLDRNNLLNEVRKSLEEYKPLRQGLDNMRQEIGLSSEPVDEEDIDLATEMIGERDSNVPAQEKPAGSEINFFVNEGHHDPVPLLPPSDHHHTSHPPPMKICMACHQPIHRNAPICPMCKAKSRSKNPKKPRKSTRSDK